MRFRSKDLIIMFLVVIVSILYSFILNRNFICLASLMISLLFAYKCSLEKREGYIFGIVFGLINIYMCYINHLYGMMTFCIIFFMPFQIKGLIHNNKKIKVDERIKKLSFGKRFKLSFSCIFGTLIFSFLLNKDRFFGFSDAILTIINIVIYFFYNIKNKEFNIIWLVNNSLNIFIWGFKFFGKGIYSSLMLVLSVFFVLFNIIDIITYKRNINYAK